MWRCLRAATRPTRRKGSPEHCRPRGRAQGARAAVLRPSSPTHVDLDARTGRREDIQRPGGAPGEVGAQVSGVGVASPARTAGEDARRSEVGAGESVEQLSADNSALTEHNDLPGDEDTQDSALREHENRHSRAGRSKFSGRPGLGDEAVDGLVGVVLKRQVGQIGEDVCLVDHGTRKLKGFGPAAGVEHAA